jgi:hypothetical protein
MPGEPAQTHSAPRRRGLLAFLALSALLSLALGAASAAASPSIEGVWSFNAGKIAIQADPNGTFSGTVVAPTKFSQCTHPVGERIWSEMRERPDGSFWGLHQWYFATEQCIPNPQLGLTAWRELSTKGGAHFLRVCFSEPGSGSQPTIAPDGTAANTTFGCSNSALVGALPSVSPRDFGRYVQLPDTGACRRRGSRFTIRIHDPKNDPFTKVAVTLRSGKLVRVAKVHRHGRTTVARLNLRGLSLPSFRVTVKLTTALGDHLHRTRTYSICAPKAGHHHGRHGRRRAA